MTDLATPATRLRAVMQHFGAADAAEFARRIGVSKSLMSRALKGERASAAASPTIVLAAYRRLGLRPDYWTSDRPPEEFIGGRPDGDALEQAMRPRSAPEPLIDDALAVPVDVLAVRIKQAERRSRRVFTTLLGVANDYLETEALRRFLESHRPTEDDLRAWLGPDGERAELGSDRETTERFDSQAIAYWTARLLESVNDTR